MRKTSDPSPRIMCTSKSAENDLLFFHPLDVRLSFMFDAKVELVCLKKAAVFNLLIIICNQLSTQQSTIILILTFGLACHTIEEKSIELAFFANLIRFQIKNLIRR
jgi:hypothetical protein